MNFSEKLPAFANPQGAAGKLLIASMNIFHTPVSLWGISHLDLAGNEKILDIGCGGGINLSRFLKKVPRGHVTGIDLSPDCVNYSFMRNRNAIAEGRCSVYEGSAELLPFGANHFDVITAFETIYFWPDLPNTLKEIKRVLKPGGTFLIVNEADGYGFLDNLYPKIIKDMTVYKTEELSSILTKAGFTNIEIDTKLGCVTVSARRPVTALDKVKTAVRFDNVRKWGRAALFAAGMAAAVCTAACLLKKNKKQ
mgnify:FL=1